MGWWKVRWKWTPCLRSENNHPKTFYYIIIGAWYKWCFVSAFLFWTTTELNNITWSRWWLDWKIFYQFKIWICFCPNYYHMIKNKNLNKKWIPLISYLGRVQFLYKGNLSSWWSRFNELLRTFDSSYWLIGHIVMAGNSKSSGYSVVVLSLWRYW